MTASLATTPTAPDWLPTSPATCTAHRRKRILLLGAGGAARGVIEPLLDQQPSALVIANRTPSRAEALAERFGRGVSTITFEAADMPFDLVINATAASLAGELPPLSPRLFGANTLAYDMMYGRDTPFLDFARNHGGTTADGLGMLVEQAAEAFYSVARRAA